ncbi:MAG: hypothetical protein HY913_13075 [Desulfomonile tiedjei]|nr:hypothetical protein [Desulfomonile tiedjei]
MRIRDLTGPLGRMLGMPGRVLSETTNRGFRGFVREWPSLYAFSCWALIGTTLLFMLSGCGRYKEELESAKQQIEKLNSEVTRLTQESARLDQEKSSLSGDAKALSDKNTKMQRELDDLNKAKAALSTENNELKKKNSVAEEEIASLKREKDRLAQEVEQLKKRAADLEPQPKPPAPMPAEVGPQSAKQPNELSPCEAVLAFMKASEGIVRQQKGADRTKLLEQAHQQYAPKMKGAPPKAVKAAEDWVKEGTKYWDRSPEVALSRVLQLRNIALEACGKGAGEAGFK